MRLCDWCRERPAVQGGRFCGRKCRQAAWRLAQRMTIEAAQGAPGRFAYADPPYPGRAARFYGDQPTYAGEVDHRALVERLLAGGYMGFAISTSVDAVQDTSEEALAWKRLLPPFPETRLCAWIKPIAPCPNTYGLHNTWEPLIVVRGRRSRPGKRDWLLAQPARFGGELPGRKPIAFCAWLFACLGMQPGDELDDLFPGTGVVSRAWAEVSRGPDADARRSLLEETSPAAASDAKPAPTPGRVVRVVQVLNDAWAEGLGKLRT